MNRSPTPRPPHWQLPVGVSRSTWDYIRSEHIATDYDRYFADSALMRLDMEIVRTLLPAMPLDRSAAGAPVVADLGCGTGRVARQLLPLGYQMLNVDLSPAMLRELDAKTPAEYQSHSRCVCANLVELDQVLEPQSVDLAVCLFSSLGMIRGRQHRRRFLSALTKILKPSGKLLVHVHNRYQSLFDPGGPRWLWQSRIQSWWQRESEFGDRVYAYRNLPSMFLHIYSRRELEADLRFAGFRSIRVMPISASGGQLLPKNGLLKNVRAGGFFAVGHQS